MKKGRKIKKKLTLVKISIAFYLTEFILSRVYDVSQSLCYFDLVLKYIDKDFSVLIY